MGELHLDIYLERMRREYNCKTKSGRPKVNFREIINKKTRFEYTHKKQSGGSGQYAKVIGYIEPLDDYSKNEFVNQVTGGTIPTNYIPSCEKAYKEAIKKGFIINHPIVGMRVVLQDGAYHEVDSSDLAFRIAMTNGLAQAFAKAIPQLIEPIMTVEVTCPIEYQMPVTAGLGKRQAIISDTEIHDDYAVISAECSLNDMFGYSNDLRSQTQGKGEFSMEYFEHRPVLPSKQNDIVEEYKKLAEEEAKLLQ
ncbi:hypothetical protein ROZALSC1DRAFT_18030 [Rozella allomycis CSF55]|uniref:Elongation factor G n=1 Tax=Rozella allomycis (strain CSF55) TaxID=988480 RepID=A0A4P9YA20_ROZAC|nr:hypothetical protein ROZALSC1DRAFT_18030 [Rozella allomycis CSF55]